ncbi:MAG: YchF-related putative GTPase [Candidatus Parvarchaeota archaeon]
MKVGIIGRTNVGKSTLFKAMTMEEVEIADRPFTTINPNRGIAYVKIKCPESEFKLKCNPHNAPCIDGIRYVPFELIDVAGLVKGASKGRGLGNKFLTDAMEADALIQVIDISGKTNEAGEKAENYDPAEDIRMVKGEIAAWITGLIRKVKARDDEELALSIYKELSGLRFRYETIKEGIKRFQLHRLDEDDLDDFTSYLLTSDKKMIIACNKMDITEDLEGKLKELRSKFDYTFIPCSAEAELTIKEAERHGFVRYDGKRFEIIKEINKQQRDALDIIAKILDKFGSTGVDTLINELVFKIMNWKVVFPVADEKKLTDSQGRVMPDAYIMAADATPKDLAEKVHTEVAKNYKGAIDCRTGLKIRNDKPIDNGQIIKIIV